MLNYKPLLLFIAFLEGEKCTSASANLPVGTLSRAAAILKYAAVHIYRDWKDTYGGQLSKYTVPNVS